MSSVFAMDVPEEIGGASDYMTEPGAFHFLVTDIRNGKKRNGDILSGFSVELEAVTGNEKGKKVNLDLRNGELSHKDHGEMCRRKQAAFLIAANVISPTQLGQKGVKVDLESARGAQLCAELELGEPSATTGRRYLDIRFANFYHLDDPRAEKIAKDAMAMEIIPASLRRKAEYFDSIAGNKTQKSKSALSDEEFDNL